MKQAIHRRMHRSAHDAFTSKKDSQQKQQFFGESITPSFFQPLPVVQRKCADCEKQEKKVQRHADKKEDKLQKKEAGYSSKGIGGVGSYISSLNGKGNSLPAKAKQFFAARMGYDFSHVKIHSDKEATQSAKAVNAKAYTVGNNIVFNEGQFNDESGEGKTLLAHELAHVIQQDKQPNNLIERLAEETNHTAPVNFGKWNYHNTTHYANCRGVKTHGKTDAHYSDSSEKVKGKTKTKKLKSVDCPENCDDCIYETGTLRSNFNTKPVITLPPIPGHLNPCEKIAVKNFYDTILRPHEQEHVRRFNTYRGVVDTDYDFTGCKSDLNDFLANKHAGIESPRKSASDSLSGAIDPFFAVFDCECPDPETKTKD